ncbi:hypothetical protein [Pyxidicoccus xibeiensis]|uniref:hypothetical protein n=1 Tax=Pyxidicoccus xibeiensis TaxID=2906759 RepID=UPI0020A79D5E|nr:hypothetical protein [Pyxidicoccus xibeiensis]MCP3139385.1 hypothetical protein [Pyxidicoccus xibeiensis]
MQMNWNRLSVRLRIAVLASGYLLAAGCDSEGKGLPVRQITRQAVVPACAGMEYTYSSDWEGVTHFVPACYPAYAFKYDGFFLASTGQAVPRLERTCGEFQLLVVFFDTASQRELLRQNPNIPESARAQLETERAVQTQRPGAPAPVRPGPGDARGGNPRSGAALNANDVELLSEVLNGWHDVDADGIPECIDTEIQGTPQNVDADWVPDTLDPSLTEDNGPFLWIRGEGAGRSFQFVQAPAVGHRHIAIPRLHLSEGLKG